jgi:PAS domain S-box-containing protein
LILKNRLNTSVDEDNRKFLDFSKGISDHIFDNSRSMISIINRNYKYEKVNATFCHVHKTENESVIGMSLDEFWGSETFRNDIKNNIDLCFSGNTVSYEAQFETPLYGNRFFEVVLRPFISESGVITHLLAETFDIHELRQSRQLAEEKEEELRKFETNLPLGFLRCDYEGRILHVNKAFIKIMDCADDSVISGMNLRSFFNEDKLFEILLDQLSDCNTKSFGRVVLRNCEGKEIPCRLSGFLASDDNGKPSYIDFAIEDSSRELLLENRLLQAQKLETIGALAGGIAHDFNNILATISGYSEMLIEDLPEGSDMSEKVCKIQTAVQKARSITNQILTFSRQVEQEKVNVSVSKILKETIGFVKSAVPDNIQIKSRIAMSGSNVYADPTQLFRVFLNLMTNALQSMEENGGTLFVTMAVVEGRLVKHELNKDIVADQYVLLTFKDTGKGMEPSLIARIFEPFFTTREVGKGTGLGLSVIHGIVSEMEGEILVSSKKDIGSAFYVYLPVSNMYPDLDGDLVKKKKIIFIAGNKYESRILSIALESTGYELIYISDRSHLLKVLGNKGEIPDLLIYMTDSREIDQDDLSAVFTKLEISIPCIYITEPNKGLLQEKVLNSGIISQQLIKPVSLKELRNAIQDSVQSKS